MRTRPQDEWIHKDVPELRIIPDDLWNQVKTRQKELLKQTRGLHGGVRNLRHLFSGLIYCGDCGGRYTMKDTHWMACSFHRNRGPNVCANSRMVRREVLEQRLLRAVEQEILSPSALAYLTRRVNEALAKAETQNRSARRGLEADLRKAEREVENIEQAVRLGKARVHLLEMLEEGHAKVSRIRGELETEPRAKDAVVKVFPSLVEKYARDLRHYPGS